MTRDTAIENDFEFFTGNERILFVVIERHTKLKVRRYLSNTVSSISSLRDGEAFCTPYPCSLLFYQRLKRQFEVVYTIEEYPELYI